MKSLGTKYVVVISGKEEREKEKGIGRGVVGCLALVLGGLSWITGSSRPGPPCT